MALEEFGAMKRELAGIESEMRRINAQLLVQRADLKGLDSEKLPQELLDEYVAAHPSVHKEQQEVARLELQIKEYGKLVTSNSPRLRQYEEELKIARVQ